MLYISHVKETEGFICIRLLTYLLCFKNLWIKAGICIYPVGGIIIYIYMYSRKMNNIVAMIYVSIALIKHFDKNITLMVIGLS